MGLLSSLFRRGARAVEEPVTRLPVNFTRELGPNAMPIAPPAPFRNSLRGGSEDLAQAARMGRAPDGGSAGAEQRVTVYRGERDRLEWDAADREPDWGVFYAGTPEEANTHALQWQRVRTEPVGGRVYRDTIDPTGFEVWDLKKTAPSASEIRARVEEARARGVPGLILENVKDRATPVSGRGRNIISRQYLVIDESRIEGGRPRQLPNASNDFPLFGVGAAAIGGGGGLLSYSRRRKNGPAPEHGAVY